MKQGAWGLVNKRCVQDKVPVVPWDPGRRRKQQAVGEGVQGQGGQGLVAWRLEIRTRSDKAEASTAGLGAQAGGRVGERAPGKAPPGRVALQRRPQVGGWGVVRMGEGSRQASGPKKEGVPAFPPLLPHCHLPHQLEQGSSACARPPVPRELGVPPPHRQKCGSEGTEGLVKIK